MLRMIWHDSSIRLRLFLTLAGVFFFVISSGLVFSENEEEKRFIRLDYAPLLKAGGEAPGGKFILSFTGKVEGKMRREVGLPLFYLDILGAAVDISPLVTPFGSGPVRLVRLTQISREPSVVRATFFLRSLFSPRVRSLPDGMEVVFESFHSPATPEESDKRPTPFSLISPEPAKPAIPSSTISLDVKSSEIRPLLLELAKQAGMGMNFRDPVDGTIDLTATAANPLEAIKMIVANSGGSLTIEDGEIWVSSKNNPLLSFSDADYVQGADLRGLTLGDVLRALGQLGQLNVVLDPSMGSLKEKTVDVLLSRMSYRQAFETLLKVHDLFLRPIDQKTVLVMTRKEAFRATERSIRVVSLTSDVKKVMEIIKSSLPEAYVDRVSIKDDQGNLLLVGDKESVEQVVRLVESIEGKLLKAGEGVIRQFFQPINTKPEDLVKLVGEALGEGSKPKITLDQRTDMLVVAGPKELVERAMELLKKMDQPPTPQALIYIRLAEIKHDALKTLGIKLDKKSISVDDIGRIPSSIPLPATLHFLESQGKARTLANPTIRCMDKEEASIDLTEQIPVKSTVTNYLPVASTSLAAQTSDTWTNTDVGIKLEVKPLIHKDDEVSLDLKVDFTELVKFVEGHPWTAKRNIKTKVRVKSGESVVIGGLIRRTKSETREPFPVLNKIRPLKWLNKLLSYRDGKEEDTEMVVIITPKIVGSGGGEPSNPSFAETSDKKVQEVIPKAKGITKKGT